MRIISGELKGRKLHSIKGSRTRPTSDRIRESIFNILSPRIHNSTVLDLFAGTGAMGIEALSRGADHAVFLDNSQQAVSAIRQNVALCGVQERSEVIQWNIIKNLNCMLNNENMLDIIFMDPPYNQGLIEPTLVHISRQIKIHDKTVITIEHSILELLPESFLIYRMSDQRAYGKSLVSFFICDI